MSDLEPQSLSKLLSKLLYQVLAIARQAGAEIDAIYHTDFTVENKLDQSPLTAADLAAHRHIVAALSALSPWPILSEEAADIPWETRRQWQRYWLVDPLDGTKEFVKRNGEFTVNIALIDAGEPILGVVVAPVLKRAYFAAKGVGAFRQDDAAPAQAIHIAANPAPGKPLRVLGSRSHSTPEMDQFLQLLQRIGPIELLSIGSSLKFCLLAEGAADVYPRLGPTSEWDTAAAHCVLQQAGGEVLNPAMQPLRYNQQAGLLNPYFIAYAHDEAQWRLPWLSLFVDTID